MGAKTKYSRDTWSKNQLRDSISNTPKYGTKACNLCEYGSVPSDLSFKVSRYKTCGDVYLELSLINPSQATCQAGQDAYRDECCRKSFMEKVSLSKPKPLVSVAIGLFLFWIFTKKARRVSCATIRRDDDDESANKCNDMEGRGRSSYKHMVDDGEQGAGKRRPRSKSKSKEVTRARSRSKSRDRTSTLGPRAKDSINTSLQNSKAVNVSRTFKKSTSKNYDAKETQLQPYYHLPTEGQWHEGHFQQGGILDEISANAYYNLDDDTSCNEYSTQAGRTTAGGSMDAVLTQVV